MKFSIWGVAASKGSAALLGLGRVGEEEMQAAQTAAFSPSSNHLPCGLRLGVILEISLVKTPPVIGSLLLGGQGAGSGVGM